MQDSPPPQKRKRSRVSAGLLMFRCKSASRTESSGGEIDPPKDGFAVANIFEVLLAHPGGPFFRNKDDGVWTIPKGEVSPGEDLLTRAQIEFEEEIGVKPSGGWIPLGSIKQKGGKTVHAWAVEGDLPDPFEPRSNTFQIEWPPHSGKLKEFPEIDRAKFFPERTARQKINPAQVPFLDHLWAVLAMK